jgi:uncharacterized membrane protein YfcA
MDRPWQDSSAYCPPSPRRREDNAAMSFLVLSAVALATLVTSFISGILGMAGGMILMGVLIVALPLPAAMLLHGITQLAANGWRGWMLRGSIDWRILRGYTLGAGAALVVFGAAQLVVSKPVALLILGIGPFVGLMLPERLHLNVERKGHASACGFVCGGLALVSGVSGPILDLFFVRSKMGRHAVVATKAATQSLTHLTKVVYFGGLLTTGRADVAPAIAALMVALAFAGTTLSRTVLERIDDRVFRRWTRWTMMGVGAAYLIGGASLLARAG